jgi:phage terminase large subunit-like protein
LPSLAKKTERARSIQALASTKSIVWPRHSPWRAEVEKQLLQFPAGKLDDAVDVFSLIGRGLEHIRPAAKPLVRPQIVQSGGWQA